MAETARGFLVEIDDLNCSFGYLQPSRKVHCSNHSSGISHGLTYAFVRPYFEGQKHTPRWINFPYLSIPCHTHPKMDSFTLGFGQNSWLFSNHERSSRLPQTSIHGTSSAMPIVRNSQPQPLAQKKLIYRLLIFFLWPSFSVAAKTHPKKRQTPNISSTPTYRTYLNKTDHYLMTPRSRVSF